MIYFAKYRKKAPDFEKLDVAQIDRYAWGGEYRPRAQACLCFVEGSGFVLRMLCDEAEPLARYTAPDDPVYTDSCLEFFLDCYPELGLGYFNFECNANGALLCAFGPRRENRRFVRADRRTPPQPQVIRQENRWGFTITIPLELIKAYYGRCDFQQGDIMAGNFYKCGEDTPVAHFGSWSAIRTPAPDFHQPRYFGQIIIA